MSAEWVTESVHPSTQGLVAVYRDPENWGAIVRHPVVAVLAQRITAKGYRRWVPGVYLTDDIYPAADVEVGSGLRFDGIEHQEVCREVCRPYD